MDKPCSICTKCQDPNKCENKNCKDWKAWFLDRWKKLHNFYKRYGENGGKGNGK